MRMLAATAGLAMTLSTAAWAQGVGGRYIANGTNIDGSPYKGTATITRTSNSTCTIHWVTGPTTSEGFCMLANKSFAAAYKLGEAVGLVVYELHDDGTLDGVWTIAGRPGAGTEVLTPAR